MNSKEIEEGIRDYLQRTSVLETVSAQYYIYISKHRVAPSLIQVNRTLKPAYLREVSQITGAPLDSVAALKNFQHETAAVQFVGMPDGEYLRLFAPNKDSAIL